MVFCVCMFDEELGIYMVILYNYFVVSVLEG